MPRNFQKPEKSQYALNLSQQNPFSAVFTVLANGDVLLYLAFTPHSQSVSKFHQLYPQNAPPIPPLLSPCPALLLWSMPPSVLLMMVFTVSRLMFLHHRAARMSLLFIWESVYDILSSQTLQQILLSSQLSNSDLHGQ